MSGFGEYVHPIEAESYRIMRSRLDLSHLPPLSRAVTERIIHASADFDYATDLVCDEEALAAGAAALAAGAPVVADVAMVAVGVAAGMARPEGANAGHGAPARGGGPGGGGPAGGGGHGGAPGGGGPGGGAGGGGAGGGPGGGGGAGPRGGIICKIGEPLAMRLARSVGITRAAAAVRLAFADAGPGAVWVVGCAPTALAEILHRDVQPAFVIGLPVGFVGAVEAKDALRASGLPALTNVSEKGGSAVAAAALNALLRAIRAGAGPAGGGPDHADPHLAGRRDHEPRYDGREGGTAWQPAGRDPGTEASQ